jgi:hypothetical protein
MRIRRFFPAAATSFAATAAAAAAAALSPISDEYPSSFDEYPSSFDGYSSSALPTLYSAASDPFGADASADVTSSGLVEGPGATCDDRARPQGLDECSISKVSDV